MGVISRLYNFVAGTPAVADQVDAEFDQILGVLNGNVDAANLAAGGVTKAKLATDALNAFLKLNSAANLKVAFGSAAPGTGFSNASSGNVPHGLATGSPPVVAFAIAHGGFNWIASIQSMDATNLNIGVQTTDSSMSLDWGSGLFPVYWLAIG